MEYQAVQQFTEPREAFEDESPQGQMSQAAFLLTLGFLLRREYEAGWQEMGEYDPRFPGLDPMPGEGSDFAAFASLMFSVFGELPHGTVVWPFGLGGEIYWSGELPPEYVDSHRRAMRELAWRLIESPDTETASRLIALGAGHPNQLIAVCSTISSLQLLRVRETGPVFGRLAEFALRSPFESVRDLAGRVLALVTQGSTGATSSPAQPASPPPPSAPLEPEAQGPDSLLFHGTKPPSPPGNSPPTTEWWTPGQPFHDYLLNSQSLNLFCGTRPFQWEGGYRDDAREVASRNLYDWLQVHLQHPVKLIAHSHGGNVAMAATHLASGNTVINGPALNVEQLVLLSTPIHWSHYYPCPGRVSEVVDVRVRHDLVIYAERVAVLLCGGLLPSQRIPPSVVAQQNPPIRECPIQGHWGNHFACYDQNVWQHQGIQL